MNTKKRYLYGLISTLLFTVGLARAAERFDPVVAHKTSPTSILQTADGGTTFTVVQPHAPVSESK